MGETYQNLLSVMPELMSGLAEENDRLKGYIISILLEQNPNKSLIDIAFQLYSERIFSMRDVLHFTNISVQEFYDLLNEKEIPFQYEDNFRVDEEDLKDWLNEKPSE